MTHGHRHYVYMYIQISAVANVVVKEASINQIGAWVGTKCGKNVSGGRNVRSFIKYIAFKTFDG